MTSDKTVESSEVRGVVLKHERCSLVLAASAASVESLSSQSSLVSLGVLGELSGPYRTLGLLEFADFSSRALFLQGVTLVRERKKPNSFATKDILTKIGLGSDLLRYQSCPGVCMTMC